MPACRAAPAPGAAHRSDRAATLAARHIRVVFFVHGLLMASWTAHIPHVKASLGLSDAGLGLTLLGAPIGSVLAVVAAAPLLSRLGSRRVVEVALCGYALAGVLVGLAGSPLALAAALAVWGGLQGLLDVAMNTQGIAAQQALGRPIMSGLHAGWSLGAFAGAGAGALGVALGISLTAQLAVLGPLAGVVALAAPGPLLPDAAPGHGAVPARDAAPARDRGASESDAAPGSARIGAALRSRQTWLLGGVAFAGMLCEGAAADWSAVFLRTATGASPGVAGLGYAAFAAAMVSVRLVGDRVLARRPARSVLPLLALVATVGMALAVATRTPAATLVGLAALGIGLGLVVPSAFGAAGRLPGIPTGTGVAAVSAVGWTGFVGGPPVIGRLAGALTLPVALVLVPVLTAVVAVSTRVSGAFAPAPDRGAAPAA